MPVAYYWDGDLKPFATQEEIEEANINLPTEGQTILVRAVDRDQDIRDDIPVEAAVVLNRTFELWYDPPDPDEAGDDNSIMLHRIVLVKRPK